LQPISGADGVKIAVLRKNRAILVFIRAAAHLKRSLGPLTILKLSLQNIIDCSIVVQ